MKSKDFYRIKGLYKQAQRYAPPYAARRRSKKFPPRQPFEP